MAYSLIKTMRAMVALGHKRIEVMKEYCPPSYTRGFPAKALGWDWVEERDRYVFLKPTGYYHGFRPTRQPPPEPKSEPVTKTRL